MGEEPRSTMGRHRSSVTAVLIMMMGAVFAGCLANEEEPLSNPITMDVHYEATSGTITKRMQNNAVIAENGVELSFDYARVVSKAGTMKTYSFDPGDDVEGANTVTINANEQAEITYTYLTHGLFNAVLTAVDENNNNATLELVIRIDEEIDWTQTNTDEPTDMAISTVPDCLCVAPERIDFDSTITNRNEIVPGTQVTVTWHLDNPDGDEKAFHTEQIGDGQDATWEHQQYQVGKGTWALRVTIDTGNESIDLHHIVRIEYEAAESTPNPIDAVETERRSSSV